MPSEVVDVESQAGPVIPESGQNPQSPQGEFNAGDSSGPLFSLYSKIAKEQDDEMTNRWQQDAKDILIFTGLFSAAVSVLLAVSVLDLKPNSQDISAVYLANIYQVLSRAGLNITIPPTSIPSIPPPTPFSPPRSAVWVNSLWFLSLVINLTCALLATSLHQWSRQYIKFSQPSRYGPETRARSRAFFRGGMDKMHLPWAVEALPALIHLSLFLFFAGLAIFLFNINRDTFDSVIWWIVGFTALYGLMTAMPIFRLDSPYYSPLSKIAWSLHAVFSYTLFRVLAFIPSGRFVSTQTSERFRDFGRRYRDRMSGNVWKVAVKTISTQSELSKIDRDILDYTISSAQALGDDKTLEASFDAIPGFFDSPLVENLKRPLPDEVRSRIVDSLAGFLDRNLSSNSVSNEIKIRRLAICMKATKEIGQSGDIHRILTLLAKRGTLGEDDTQEKFFDAIPGFFDSPSVEKLKGPLPDEVRSNIVDLLEGFLGRNLSSNSVRRETKIRRLVICMNAVKKIGESGDIYRILTLLTNRTLGEDDTQETFLEAIPGFLNSPEVKNLENPLPDEVRLKIVDSLQGFLTRNLFSDSVTEEIKIRRLDISKIAAKDICKSSDVATILRPLLSLPFKRVSLSFETAESLEQWGTSINSDFPNTLRWAVANSFLFVRDRDDRWIKLAEDKFGLPKDDLRDHIAHGDGDDSVFLAILIHVTRQLHNGPSARGWDVDILPSLSKFDMRKTDPELQHEFCDLWNEIVQKGTGTDSGSNHRVDILDRILHLAVALQGRQWFYMFRRGLHDGKSRYELCTYPSHRPDSSVPHPTQPYGPSRTQSLHSPGHGTAAQQLEVEETSMPSSPDHATLVVSTPISPYSKSNPAHMHTSPHATAHSIHEVMQTLGPDLNRLVSNLSALVSLLQSQSSSSTANFTTKIGPNDEPSPDISPKGETSQSRTATLLTETFRQHPQAYPVPVVFTPSSEVHPSSLSARQQDAHKRQDRTVSYAESDHTLFSPDATKIPPISIASVTLPSIEGLTGVPSTTVSDPQSSPHRGDSAY